MAGLDIVIAAERDHDADAIAGLETRAFGPGRFARTAYRLREENPHDLSLSFVARVSTLVVGSVRLTQIRVGDAPALLLGPLTVDPAFRSKGIAQRLVETALAAAEAQGHRAVLLVGDEAYYTRMGFKPAPASVQMPGPVDPRRVLVRAIGSGPDAPLSGRVSP